MDIRRACPLFARLLIASTLLAPSAGAAGQTVTLHQGGKNMRITIGDAAALPADFPQDVALPATYALVRVERKEGSTAVVVEAPGTVDDQATRFRAGMLAAGWGAAMVVPPATGQAQAWVKEQRAVVAWLTPADAGNVRLQLHLLARR